MKLVTYRNDMEPRIGFVLDNKVIDIQNAYQEANIMAEGNTTVLPSDMTAFLSLEEEAFTILRKLMDEIEKEPEWISKVVCPLNEVTLLAPILKPGKILCIGLNYADHTKEGGREVPKEPVVFGKYSNSIIGSGDAIRMPSLSNQVDYEAELAVVIGKKGFQIKEQNALEYVAGYMNFNDVSARDLQRRDGQWMKGKFLDTFAPIGPYLVTWDEIPDPSKLDIMLRLNGETMQHSNTGNMIFSVIKLISFLSSLLTLEPGDIIATGTPSGVGYARKPPVFLKTGDLLEVEIEGLGILKNTVK